MNTKNAVYNRELQEQQEEEFLAPYACHASRSSGRLYPEEEHSIRTCYQRDRDRIIHATSFRRLNGKTQVFVANSSDHYRTRLTHTLEVAQIARSISRMLGLNEDLTEAVALAHDMGHPPFGHAGERVLHELMEPFGGFEHNQQALRMVDLLETRYPAFPGLNLTAETRRSILKKKPVNLGLFPKIAHVLPLEAQVVDLADEISYTTHDLDDGIESGLIRLQALETIPLWKDAVLEVRERYPELDEKRIRAQVILKLINEQVNNVVQQTRKNLTDQKMKFTINTVSFTPTLLVKVSQVREYLYANLYRHPRVVRSNSRTDVIIRRLFDHYCRHPEKMSPSYQERIETEGLERSAADFIAGMTDHFAEEDSISIF
jgi:dGTPase